MLTLWVLVLASLFSRRLVDTGSHVLSGRTLAKNEVDSGRHSVCRVYLHTHETPVRIVTADEMCVRALLYFSKSNPVARTVGTCRR